MAEISTALYAGAGGLWVMRKGTALRPEFLLCHGASDLTEPEGDITLTYCADPSEPNKFVPNGSYQAAPGPRTTTITGATRKGVTAMEIIKRCPLHLYFQYTECGRKDIFGNGFKGTVFMDATITNRGKAGVVARSDGDQTEALRTYDVSAPSSFDYNRDLNVARVTLEFTEALNAIAPFGFADCDNLCVEPCESLVIVGDATSGSPSDTALGALSINEGQDFDAFAAQPFAAAQNIASVATFQLGANTKRIVVARGTTDAGNPAEISYSDDSGATWTDVDVGSTNGQFAYGAHSLFALDLYHMWLVTSGGYIYFSEDGGQSWDAQEEGVLTAGVYRAIHFSDANNGYAVAAGDIIVKTTDGGATWSATTTTGTASALNTVAVIGKNDAYVGTAGGKLFRTTDGGTTWTEQTFSGSGTGGVTTIKAYNKLVLYMTHNTAGNVGRIFRTVDAGFDWELLTMPASVPLLNDLVICDVDTSFAVGEIGGGLSTLYKVSPVLA